MIDDGAFNHKIDYVTFFMENLNVDLFPNCITGSKLRGFAYWWSSLGRVCVQPAKQACLNKEAKMSKISKNVAQVVPDAPLAFFHLYVEM